MPGITLGAHISKSTLDKRSLFQNRSEIQREKKWLYEIILVYINYQYIKTAEKMTLRKTFFSITAKNCIYC